MVYTVLVEDANIEGSNSGGSAVVQEGEMEIEVLQEDDDNSDRWRCQPIHPSPRGMKRGRRGDGGGAGYVSRECR